MSNQPTLGLFAQFAKNAQPAQPVQTTPSSLFGLASAPQAPVTQYSHIPITNVVIRDEDIDRIGSDIARQTTQVTNQIISKISVSNFDEIGEILVQVQTEADALDPASLNRGGITGWWNKTFGNVKKQLTLRLKNADQVFTALETKITEHVATQTQWVKSLENLYTENYTRYTKIREVIVTAKQWEQVIETSIAQWPPIDANDPEAGMKSQLLRDTQSRLNRLRIKIDNFVRLQAITENNAVKIRNQQETAKTTIQTLRDLIDQTIPLIKSEFASFIASLDAQKSIELVDKTRQLANRTLERSADTAKNAAIASATALNTPGVSNETLSHIRSRMIETITEIRRIEDEAQRKRIADEAAIIQGQKQYLQALNQ